MLRLLVALVAGLGVSTAGLAAIDWAHMSAQLEADDARCARGSCDYSASTALVERLQPHARTVSEKASLMNVRAEIQRRRQLLAEAVELATAALALDPQHQRARYTLGETYASLGRPDAAAAAFEQAAASTRDSELGRTAACRAAQSRVEQGRIDHAMLLLPKPVPPSAWLGGCLKQLAVLADKAKHLSLAAEAYLRAGQALQSDPEPWLRAMYLFAHLGQRDRTGAAVAEFSRRGLAVPTGYEATYLYALSAAASPSAALQLLRAWHRREPASAWIRENLATKCAEHGLHAEAEGHYRALLSAGGERRQAHLSGLLGVLVAQRRMSEAVAACDAHAADVATSAHVKLHCAAALQVRGSCDRALPLFREVMSARDAPALKPHAALGAGMCLEASGDLRGALAAYATAPEDAAIAPRVRIVTRRLGGR